MEKVIDMDANEETPNPWYGYEGAASALGDALRDLRKYEKEAELYHYSLPTHLEDDMKQAARRVRNAVRYLMSEASDS